MNALMGCIIPAISEVRNALRYLMEDKVNNEIMLGLYGQPAVPTTMSKELLVFYYIEFKSN